MAKLPVVFKYGTRAEYDALAEKSNEALYFLTDTGEIYRGNVNLARGNHYEGTRGTKEVDGATVPETDNEVIARVLGDFPAVKDDIFVIKTLIAGEAYSYTSLIYNGENWAAMDGNYSADNVYFNEDFVVTSDIGAFLLPEGESNTKLNAAGKNLKQLLASLLAKQILPEATLPEVTVSFSNAKKAVEVGTKVVPTFTASLSAGSYTYGPETGITATSWSVTSSEGETVKANTGSFAEITVGDNTSFSATALAEYTEGATPIDNLGNDVEEEKIAAGSDSGTTATKITGYRNYFYGVLNTTTAEAPITSDLIRGLTHGGAYNAKKTFTMKASDVEGAKRMIVAYPANAVTATRKGLTSVILPNSLNFDAVANNAYVKQANVDVEGADGYTATPYIVWLYEPDAIDATEIHNATLA